MKRKIIPGQIATKDLHQYMIGAVSPRPIAFVSTIDENGLDNLAPYSFFNAFSSNPPIVVFSSNRRVSNNTTKDTLHNVSLNKEVVVNAVSYNIVRQMSITSAEYPHEVSEWEKSGLTKEDAYYIKPKLVKESPVNMECRVKDIIPLGDQGGAGHLIICDVLMMHIDESVLDGDRIDPHKIDLMGRMGRTYYVRTSGDAIMSIHQPVLDLPVGFDALPHFIKHNPYLTGNEIGIIASLTELPELPENSITDINDTGEMSFINEIKNKLHKGEVKEAYVALYNYYTMQK
jgi:flavin reductase (DIM6/NTAB) family NADH-FMN oxidoreductase RutF